MDCNFLTVVFSGCAAYLGAYLNKKGENHATKEDVAEITRRIESIKQSYSAELFVHQTRYQNEFEILKELSGKVFDLKSAALALDPEIDFQDPKESDEDRKRKRLQSYQEAGKTFFRFSETQKPFYSDEIYTVLKNLDEAVWKKVVNYKHGVSSQKEYWDKALKSAKEVSELADQVVSLIGKRVKYWERFGSQI